MDCLLILVHIPANSHTIVHAVIYGRYFMQYEKIAFNTIQTLAAFIRVSSPPLAISYHRGCYKSIRDCVFFSSNTILFIRILCIFRHSSKRSHHFPKYMCAISFSRYPISIPTNTIHAKFICSDSPSSDSAWSLRFFLQSSS